MCAKRQRRCSALLQIREEALQELLRGQWSDVTESSYRPSADGYIKPRDEILGMVIEGL
jgi:hypothetical protein